MTFWRYYFYAKKNIVGKGSAEILKAALTIFNKSYVLDFCQRVLNTSLICYENNSSYLRVSQTNIYRKFHLSWILFAKCSSKGAAWAYLVTVSIKKYCKVIHQNKFYIWDVK